MAKIPYRISITKVTPLAYSHSCTSFIFHHFFEPLHHPPPPKPMTKYMNSSNLLTLQPDNIAKWITRVCLTSNWQVSTAAGAAKFMFIQISSV